LALAPGRHADCSGLCKIMSVKAWIGASMIALLGLAACGDSSPTGPSPLPASVSSPSTTSSSQGASGSRLSGSGSMGASDTEEFNCLDVETTRVRFGPPGYVEDDRVGLYVYFGGMATGPKRLRIWWDVEHDPVTYHDFVFDESETEIEDVYEHQYSGLNGPVEMLARVELIRDGLTGNCARNRRVVVSPPILSSGSSAPTPTVPGPTKTTANVGPPISAVNGTGFGVDGIRFIVSTALTLDSVWIQPTGSGNVTIELTDDLGTITFASKTVAVSAGAQQVSLGFNIAPGDYVLTLDPSALSAPSAGLTIASASFPYDVAGVISLTDTAYYWGFFGFYQYLYDWQITY